MKIAVLGATGRVGSAFINIALQESWQIRALARDCHKINHHTEDMKIIEGNVFNQVDIEKTLEGCDKVFVSLGTDKTNTLSTSAPMIVAAMKKLGLTRSVIIGTAGILDSRYESGKFRFETSESKRKSTTAAEEHLKAYETWKGSGLDWTYICPTYLPDGEAQGDIRHEPNFLPENGKKITVGDTARFAFSALTQNKFIQQRIGLCY